MRIIFSLKDKLQLLKSTLAICMILFFTIKTTAYAGEIFSDGRFSLSVADNQSCASSMTVRMDAKTQDDYLMSRLDIEATAKKAQTYLWLDCNKLQKVLLKGYVNGQSKPIYFGKIEKKNNWTLEETSKADQPSSEEETTTPTPTENAPEASKDKGITESDDNKSEVKYSSIEELKKKAKISEKAKIELAKKLLGLPNQSPELKVKKNPEEGQKILEELAQSGNAEATHYLGEAYATNKQLKVNYPLVRKLVKNKQIGKSTERGKVGAMLATKAMTMGSPAAAFAFYNAGRLGSHTAFYSLGRSYLLDRRGRRMPFKRSFVRKRYGIRTSSTGRRYRTSVGSRSVSRVSLGMHFMGLAAGTGSVGAMGFLSGFGLSAIPGSYGGVTIGNGTSSSSMNVPSSQNAFSQIIANNISDLSQNGFVDTMIEDQELNEKNVGAGSSGEGEGAPEGQGSTATTSTTQSGSSKDKKADSQEFTKPILID